MLFVELMNSSADEYCLSMLNRYKLLMMHWKWLCSDLQSFRLPHADYLQDVQPDPVETIWLIYFDELYIAERFFENIKGHRHLAFHRVAPRQA